MSDSKTHAPDRAAPIVICGQGLAGTLLAWALLKLGKTIVIYDRQDPVTSSKIAAGIVTPITGQRITLSPDVDQFLPEALACYGETAQQLGRTHYHPATQVRLWQNAEEPARFAVRCGQTDFAEHLAAPAPGPLVNPDWFHGSGEGFAMATSGWLETRAWLAASAAWFTDRGLLVPALLDPHGLQPGPGGVRLPDGTLAETVVFCEGAAARENPWFPWLTWKCAKGEVLTLTIPALAGETRIIHRGGWLLPVDPAGTFRTGSTYTWDYRDDAPEPTARRLLEARLTALLRVPWTVTAQEAAVRPIIHQSLARLGRHPVHPSLAFFNGLGSKGVLHGPRYARLLAEHLTHGAPLPDHVDIGGN